MSLGLRAEESDLHKSIDGARDILIDVDRDSYRDWMKTVPDPDFDRKKFWRSS